MPEFHNLLWAKHPKARFKPVIIGSEICTLIEDAPINWGVRLAALDFYKLDDSSWFSPTHLTESQFLSIDIEILLFLITAKELSIYISQILDENNTLEVLNCQPDLALGAKKFITDDLRFTSGKLFTPGQLETVLQRIKLAIPDEYTVNAAHAIDYVIRRIPNYRELLTKDEQRKQECVRLYLDKYQQPHRLKCAVNHRFNLKVAAASKEHFGNCNRAFILRINFDGSHTLILRDEVGRPARYPEVMSTIFGELTDGKIDFAIAELLKNKHAQKSQILALNGFIENNGVGQFITLGLIADVMIDSNNASHSDVAEVIESVSTMDLGRIFTSITTIPIPTVGNQSDSVVVIRCGSHVVKSTAQHGGSKWVAALALNQAKRSSNFSIGELTAKLSSGGILSIDEAVKGNHIRTPQLKRIEYITHLFNQASDYLVYSGLTLKPESNWIKELSTESNGWAARSLLRHLAAGNEHLVLIQRSSKHLECQSLPNPISLSGGERAAQHELESWFHLAEDDHLSVLNERHLVCPEPVYESSRLCYISYDEMREKGWRARVAVLYKEVERYFRRQISAESVEQLLCRYELELILLSIVGTPRVKSHELLTQMLNVIAAYVAKNPNEISFLGVDSKAILSVSGRMKIDAYLKYIDWPALCGDRAG